MTHSATNEIPRGKSVRYLFPRSGPSRASQKSYRTLVSRTILGGFAIFGGCTSLAGPLGPRAADDSEFGRTVGVEPNPVVQVSGEAIPDASDPTAMADDSLVEKSKSTAKSVTNFITGREQEDRDRAKNLYMEGDRLFRLGGTQAEATRRKTFAAAAKQFKKAGEAAPGSALEQDALFMRAESLFFADQLTQATDTYEKLQKEFPRNRHNDRVAARLFSISRYWIATAKADEGSWIPINLTDKSKPRIDTDGHAIRVLDQIRYDDPTGRLADDATMMAAAEYIRQQKFEEADEFLTDLRETYTDSEHLFLAHMLGIQCKLEIYAGPAYSGLLLEEADKLIRQTRQRFPDKLAGTEHGEMVARAAATVAYMRAEKLATRANYREKRREFGAARYYYQALLQDFGDTPQADLARKRLAEIGDLPAIPTQRLGWLTKVFPESRPKNPLEMDLPSDDDATQSSETLFR